MNNVRARFTFPPKRILHWPVWPPSRFLWTYRGPGSRPKKRPGRSGHPWTTAYFPGTRERHPCSEAKNETWKVVKNRHITRKLILKIKFFYRSVDAIHQRINQCEHYRGNFGGKRGTVFTSLCTRTMSPSPSSKLKWGTRGKASWT